MRPKPPLSQTKAILRLLPVLATHPRQLRYMREWHDTYWSNSLDDAMPWVAFAARDWLDKNLRPEMSVFEYGSGGSTLYYADRVRRLISVEHDEQWSEVVQSQLAAKKADHVEHLFRPADPAGAAAPEGRNGYRSRRHPNKETTFRSYAESIDRFDDRSFDIVFVDGRVRNECVKHALPKVKDSGFLILDNSLRKDYEPARRLMAEYSRTELWGICPYGKSRECTTVWKIDR